MLLKHSITNAKKFFKNTLQSFKSLISGGYQRLPKTPPFNPFSCGGDSKMHQSFGDLDNFYADFTNRWDFDEDDKDKKKSKKKLAAKEKDPILDEDVVYSTGSYLKFAKQSSLEKREDEEKMQRSGRESGLSERHFVKKKVRGEEVKEERNYLVTTQRLKELELMDVSNVDHVLDLEEVLHYYSRLTCPAYLDMVDRFFMQIYSEFFLAKSSTTYHRESIQ